MVGFRRERPKQKGPPEFFESGVRFGDFEILERISVSLIGSLYRAQDVAANRSVSLFILPSKAGNDPKFGERFRQYAEVQMRVDEPGFLKVEGWKIVNNRFVLICAALAEGTRNLEAVLEAALEGDRPELPPEPVIQNTLDPFHARAARKNVRKKRLGKKKSAADKETAAPAKQPEANGNSHATTAEIKPIALPVPWVESFMVDVLHALNRAYQEGYDHLSLIPGLIVLPPEGPPLLVGVGLLRAINKNLFEVIVSAAVSPIQPTDIRKQVSINTIEAFSPEIRAGQPYNSRTDVFAVGMLIYLLLTGKKASLNRYEPVSELLPGLPETWDQLILKCLQPNPDERLPNPAVVLQELRTVNQVKEGDKARVAQLQRTIERIPVPRQVRARGAQATIVFRLSMLGVVGLVLVGLAGYWVQTILVDSPYAENVVAIETPAGREPTLRLRIQPDRARVQFRNTDSSFVVLDGQVDLNVKNGDHLMEIQSPGYRTRRFPLRVDGPQAEPLRIELQPLWAKVTFQGTPGSRITATDPRGETTTVGPIPGSGVLQLEEGLIAGEYTLTVSEPDHRDRVLEAVELSDREDVVLDVGLEPLPAKVRVESQPAGAEVWLDGEVVGRTPLVLDAVEPGVLKQIRVGMKGYRTIAQDITFKPNADVLLDFSSLILKTGEIQPVVTLDGTPIPPEEAERLSYSVGDVSFKGNQGVLAPIVEGDHILVVSHPDYKPVEVPLTVVDGKVIQVRVNLLPKPGLITVRMTPSLAFEFLANGRVLEPVDPAGSTFPLEPGEDYTVEVRVRDYMVPTREVTLDPNERLVWNLTPERIPGPVEGEAYTVPYLDIELVPIAAGSFLMGSDPTEQSRLPREGPQTPVKLTYAFWMGAHEVTQATYAALMQENPSRFKGEQRPVETVGWRKATLFAERLTAIERRAGRLPQGMAYRLPSEAEWEYAARAGTQTPFHFGEEADPSFGNFKGVYPRDFREEVPVSSIYGTVPVGQYPANAWGLHDIHGNVAEWSRDWWNARLPGTAVEDWFGPASGTQRSVRGGSWESTAGLARSAQRYGLSPGTVSPSIGFRLVLGPVVE
ncbi:MAG: SUMF1/EgtB/PvdO family nonheme iron enzyme [Opitutales bacterium]